MVALWEEYLADIVASVANIRAVHAAWLAGLLSVAAAGCKTRVDIDGERLKTELERRADVVLQRPEVDEAFDGLAEAVTSDPAVARNGEALLGQLGSDPSLQPGFQAIIQAVGEHPTVAKVMARLTRENPRAGPDKLSELFEKKFNDAIDSPAFDKAFDKAFAAVLERPDVNGAIQLYERAAASNPELNRAIDDIIKARMNDPAWNRRVIALNGGKRPDRQLATQLLLDKAFSDDRLATFYVDVVSLPVIRAKTAAACGRLLQAPAFQRHIKHALRKMVGDAGFQQGAVAAMAGMMDTPRDAEALEAPIRALLERPVVGKELASLLKAVSKDPALAPIGNEAIAGIVADPGFNATLTRLIDSW
jgi:hypothetical protein